MANFFSPKKGSRHPDVPKIFIGRIPSSGRRHSGRHGHRGPVRRLWGRLRFERRDLLIVAALLALLAALLLRGYSDRIFDSFAGKPPSVMPEGGPISPE